MTYPGLYSRWTLPSVFNTAIPRVAIMRYGSAPFERGKVWLSGPKSSKRDGKCTGQTRHSSSLLNAQDLNISIMCTTFKVISK
jgi:hypothetical protein